MFRHVALALLTGCLSAFATQTVSAQTFPDRPVNWLVGEAPGGTSDALARLISAKLAERLGQPVVVQSRPGASGTIAVGAVAHAAPDGYNIVETTTNNTTPPIGFKLDYDPLTSFAPITEIGFTPILLVVNAQVPANTLQELIAYARANPGKLNVGEDGTASTVYWASLYLMKLAGIELVNVPFSGGGPIQTALLGNEVQLTFSPVSTSLPLVRNGKLKALAVTGTSRVPALPSVPTFVEAAGLHGFDDVGMFYGLLAPAGTPKDIVNKLRNEIAAVIKSDEVRQAMERRSLEAVANTPEEFTQLFKESIDRWAALRSNSIEGKKAPRPL